MCKGNFNCTVLLFTELTLFYIAQFFVFVSKPSMIRSATCFLAFSIPMKLYWTWIFMFKSGFSVVKVNWGYHYNWSWVLETEFNWIFSYDFFEIDQLLVFACMKIATASSTYSLKDLVYPLLGLHIVPWTLTFCPRFIQLPWQLLNMVEAYQW